MLLYVHYYINFLFFQFWAAVDPDINKVYFLMAVLVSDKYCGTDLADNLIHHNMDEVSLSKYFLKIDSDLRKVKTGLNERYSIFENFCL